MKPADPAVTGSFSLSIAGRSSISSEATYYQYDVWNQLAKTTAGSKTISYSYNGEGYRTAKTENGQRTNYLYEADRVILETDANGNETARNIYGINLLTRTAGSDTINYMYNGHGDVTALLGEDGTVKGTYYYDAFGNIVEQTENVNNNITYAGYQYDSETGLYYLNARYYDSKIARFLTQDTYTGDPNDPLSLNLYTYCHNEPVMYVDPSGHAAAYLTDLAKATNGTAKWDSEKKVAVVTVNGVTQTFKLSANSVVNGKIVIDNEKFDSLFTKTSGNSLITVDTTVKNGKITATQTVKSGTYTVAQASLAGQTNNYYKDTHNPTSGNNANKANSTVNGGKTLLKTAVNVTKDFTAGAAVSGDNNLFFGAAQGISGEKVNNNSIAFQAGKVSGDAFSMIAGVGAIIGGVGGEIIGVALDGTIVFAPAGAATAVASAGLIGYGGTATYRSVNNYFKDASDLFSNVMQGGSNGGYKAGDTTPGGRTYTKHGAEQANERGFDSKTVDSIIDNNKNNRVKEIDPESGKVQWRYQDKRGNTVITDEWSTKIVTTYSHPKSANGGNYIPK